MDVKTAFLYGSLNEEIYITNPPGYKRTDGKVLRLRKSIYGLKQSPRVWYQVIDKFFVSHGMQRSSCDPAVYFIHNDKKSGGGDPPLIITIYIDDLIIVGPNIEQITQVKEALSRQFHMTDIGNISTLLGIEIKYFKDYSILLY